MHPQSTVGQHLGLLRSYYPGYSVTWLGSFVGLFYGAITGALLGSLAASTRFRLGRRARRRRTLEWLEGHGVAADDRSSLAGLAERRAALEQQIRVLAPFQRLFRYWHAFHLPLAIVMFLILIVHIAVAAAFGYVWVFR